MARPKGSKNKTKAVAEVRPVLEIEKILPPEPVKIEVKLVRSQAIAVVQNQTRAVLVMANFVNSLEAVCVEPNTTNGFIITVKENQAEKLKELVNAT